MYRKYAAYDFIPGTTANDEPKKSTYDYFVPAAEREKPKPLRVVKGVPYYADPVVEVPTFTCNHCGVEMQDEQAMQAHCATCPPSDAPAPVAPKKQPSKKRAKR